MKRIVLLRPYDLISVTIFSGRHDATDMFFTSHTCKLMLAHLSRNSSVPVII